MDFCCMGMTPFSNNHRQPLTGWMATRGTTKLESLPLLSSFPHLLGADPLQRLFLLKVLCNLLFFTFLVLLWAHGNESSYHKLLLSLFFSVLRMTGWKPFQSGFCSLWNGPIWRGAHPCFLIQDILGLPSAFLCTFRIDLGNSWLMN